MSAETPEDVFDRLERMGLIKRWFCEPCNDHVPYRWLEGMTEAQSRRKHNRSHHPRSPGETQ